jgi:hypothetical protein
MVKIHEVSARFQWNSFSRGATKMLQAYNEPNDRFINSAPTTRHHRLIKPSALIPSSFANPRAPSPKA